MSAPLDKPPVDTSAISPTQEENSRFQLSREMKILLGVLALGGAVGGWYFFSGAGTPAPDLTATTPPAQSTAAQPGTSPSTGTQPATTPGQTDAAGGPPGTVTPGAGTVTDPSTVVPTTAGVNSSNPVAVAQVPFLNPQSGTDGIGLSTDPASTEPAGINPADPLAAVPDSNPFQPLTVIGTATTASSTAALPSQASTPLPTASSVNTAPAPGTGLSGSGAIPLPSVAIGGVSSGGVNLGNTASGSTAAGSGTGLGTGGAIPLPSVPLGGLPTAGGATTGAAGAGNTGSGSSGTGSSGTGGNGTGGNGATGGGSAATGNPGTPSVKPPPAAGTITPGLATPSLGNISLGSAAVPASRPATAGSGTPATGNAAGSATGSSAGAGSASDLAASIGQPGLISQYGSANVPAIPAPVVISPLDQLVQSRNLVYNAVVLGPINTAIFKTDQGFVVVPTGQTLPDSTVVLKEVTATSATLSLGNDSKILELDKR